MTPEVGQHVKCFLRNSTVLEGKVENWTKDEVVLKSLDDQSILIIHRPLEDIMMTKVVLIELSQIVEDKIKSIPESQEKIKHKLHEVLAEPSEDPEIQKKSIAELRAMVIEQDKKIITQKQQVHFPTSGTPSTKYRQTVDTIMQLNKFKVRLPR